MRQFVSFRGGIITATNPFPRVDENTPLTGQHPCRLRNDTLRDTKEELGELLNWIEILQTWLLQVKRKVPGHDERKPFVPHGSPAAVSSATSPIQSDTCYTCLLLHFQETNRMVQNMGLQVEPSESASEKKRTTMDTRESSIRTVQ